jgi:hypothetical protein
MDRRDFIRIVVSGSVASLGCPAGLLRGAAEEGSAGARAPAGRRPAPAVRREINAFCHAVRDGAEFRLPPPARHLPAVIVGGGAAGLMAARALGDRPYLLIEKEPEVGGNATGGSWRGVGFSSGTSYSAEPLIKEVAADLGVRLLPIDSPDGVIVKDTLVPDFFGDGLRRAPYPAAVRDAFRRFLDTYGRYDVDKEVDRLDNLPFDEILKDYPREVRNFFDSYGPNNWGARVQDTSAYIGIQSAGWLGGLEAGRFTGEQGFGPVTRALGARVAAAGGDRVLAGATVVRVERRGDRVLVAYVPPGQSSPAAPSAGAEAAGAAAPRVECVTADTVVVAAPKLIAKYIVADLPRDQQDAMFNYRYIPYLVTNLCFEGVVHDACFDVDVPAPDVMSDFVCADWVTRRGKGDPKRPTVLSCYMPRAEEDREALLDEAKVRSTALEALSRIDRWFPGAAAKCREIRVRLRGHPMHLATTGMITKWGPLARRSLGPIHFAGTDGLGGVSDLAGALSTGRAAGRAAIASLAAAARARSKTPAR